MGSRRSTPDWSEVAEHVREQAAHRDAPLRELHAAALRLAGRLRGRRALDVACGEGALVRVLAGRGALAEGVDPSAERVREAERRAAEAGLDPAPAFHVGNPRDPESLPGGPFDLITALLGFDPAAKPIVELRSLARILRPGGRLVLAFAHPYVSGVGADRPLESLFQSLRDVGLRVVDLVEPSCDEPSAGSFLALLCERRRRRSRGRARRG